VHGVFTQGQVLAALRTPLLAETLSAQGLATQAFAAGGFLNAVFGFDRGFDGFASSVDPLRDRASAWFDGLLADPRSGLTRELILEFDRARVERWLAEHAGERFFLFLHTYTVHDYDPPPAYLRCAEEGCTSTRSDFKPFTMHTKSPEPASATDQAHLRHRYDAALRFIDDELGRLLDRLAELGLAESTIVAVTSDHGEEMFERGYIQHGKSLYEELTRVPLILRVPGTAPRVVQEPVMLVDLAPTLLAALGFPPDPRMQGVDLLADPPGPRLVYSEVDDLFARKTALREPGGKKLIHGPLDADVQARNEKEWELYDLAADPGEKDDLAAREPELLERLKAELERRHAQYRATGAELGAVGQGEIDDATRHQLEFLGYGGVEKN
jgi:arylsulfatase A-like enzyme